MNHRLLDHPANPLWGQLHVRHHTPPHHPVQALEAAQLCQPVGAYPVCPVGFGGPADGPHSPFPGAKKVQHTISATYDLSPQTIEALGPFLESSAGVLNYTTKGKELTITATAPAQMAIAQFLSNVVAQPKTTNGPAKTISVNFTKTKPCTSECTEAKACPTECTETKACTTECCEGKCCEGKCGEKCGCTCGKTKPAASEPSAHNTLDKRLFSFYVGLADGRACPLAAGLECQIPALGPKAATDCPATACEPVSIQVQATQTKPIVVKIHATKDGVLLQTSDGTQILRPIHPTGNPRHRKTTSPASRSHARPQTGDQTQFYSLEVPGELLTGTESP